jgi:adenylate kinase
MSEHFGWKCIDTGELLRREVTKKSEVGKKIQDAFKGYRFVDDQIVIDLVQKEIELCEQEKMSWIIQGFPRTKVQALSLQKMSVIPDKFVQLQTKNVNSFARIKNKLI